MIPLRDINPTYRFPLITVSIIGLNVVVYLVELLFQFTGQLNLFIASYAVIPFELTQGVDLAPPSLHPTFLTVFTAIVYARRVSPHFRQHAVPVDLWQ